MKTIFIFSTLIFCINAYASSNRELILDNFSAPITDNNFNIVFSAKESKRGITNLYLFDIKKEEILKLTNESTSVTGSFSLSKDKILYTQNHNNSKKMEQLEVFIMDLDGKNKKRLTVNNKPEYYPLLLENGYEVLYVKSNEFTKIEDSLAPIPSGWYNWNIYKYNIHTNEEEQITFFNHMHPFRFYLLESSYLLFEYNNKLLKLKIENKSYENISDLNIGSLGVSAENIYSSGEFYGDDEIFILDLNGTKVNTISCKGLYSLKDFNILDSEILFLATNTSYSKSSMFKSNNYLLCKVGLDGSNLRSINLNSYPIIDNF